MLSGKLSSASNFRTSFTCAHRPLAQPIALADMRRGGFHTLAPTTRLAGNYLGQQAHADAQPLEGNFVHALRQLHRAGRLGVAVIGLVGDSLGLRRPRLLLRGPSIRLLAGAEQRAGVLLGDRLGACRRRLDCGHCRTAAGRTPPASAASLPALRRVTASEAGRQAGRQAGSSSSSSSSNPHDVRRDCRPVSCCGGQASSRPEPKKRAKIASAKSEPAGVCTHARPPTESLLDVKILAGRALQKLLLGQRASLRATVVRRSVVARWVPPLFSAKQPPQPRHRIPPTRRRHRRHPTAPPRRDTMEHVQGRLRCRQELLAPPRFGYYCVL